MTPRDLRPPPHARDERGFTLLEFAVAAVPLALVGLALVASFRFTVAFSRRGEEGADVAQQAQFALQRLTTELREASAAPDAIVIWSREQGAPFDGVGFLSARLERPGRPFTTDAGGAPHWQQAVYYLHDPSTRKVRKIIAEPASLAQPPVGQRGMVLARQVARMHVARDGDLMTITLVALRPSGEVVLTTSVRPRN